MIKSERIAVRLDPEVKAALQRAAKADRRSISTMVAVIVGEYVQAQGWMKKGRKADGGRK